MPTVASVVFKITKKYEKNIDFAVFLYKIACILYKNRRKNIANNLKSILNNDEIEFVLSESKLDKNLRGEDINLENLEKISNAILKVKNRNL
ncbi:MAG TPA: hypothetical protein DEA28_02395 [Firmicutes bacterium]|nr:hypothetical protein [Bacillota bacterium]